MTAPGNRSPSIINWDSWRQGWPGATRAGQQTEGPCPVTGEGTNCCHVNLHTETAGCRKCGDGAGKLTGDQLVAHARAAGAIRGDVNLGGGSWESWTWTAADGRERRQFRTPNGKKWEKTDPPNDPPPRDLLYLPAALPAPPGPIYLTEGASDADAVHGIGLSAIGRTNAQPSGESLARLPRGAVIRIWPDVDDNQAGYRQAITWYDAATAAGLRCELVDPLALRPDAPPGFDARDWIAALPAGTAAGGAAARLESAAVDIATIRARVPTMPAAAPVWIPPAGGLPIPRQRAGTLCDSEETAAQEIRRTAAGRLAFVYQSGEWLVFGSKGWQSIHRTAVEEACTDFARLNVGSLDKNGDLKMTPRSTGRKSVGRAITQLLEPMIGTEFVEWDATRNVVMLPDGALLDVFTGERRPSAPADRIRRRVPVAPASEPDYNRSVFRRVIEHVILNDDERAYLQRRLGAALVDAEGMDDLIWLYGPPGAGKGTLLHALAQTFGDYGRGVPANELIKGVQHDSHPAWKARLAGARILFADDVRTGHELEDTTVNLLLGSLITAHHMRLAPFDFRLNAPLIVTSNGEPRQATTNVRRLKPIECGPAAGTEDPAIRGAMGTLPERAACLRWLMVGAFRWKREGCAVPESIRARAREVAANAPVAEFTRSFEGYERVQSSTLYDRWRTFTQSRGCGKLATNQTALAALLKANGWRLSRSNGIRYLTPPDSVPVPGSAGFPIDVQESPRSHARVQSGTRHYPALPPSEPVEMAPPDLPAGALGSANGGDDQGPPPPEHPAENPAPPPAPLANGGDLNGGDLNGSDPTDDLLDTLASVLRDPVAHHAAAPPRYCRLCHRNRAMVKTDSGLLLCPTCRKSYNAMDDEHPPTLLADAEAIARRVMSTAQVMVGSSTN